MFRKADRIKAEYAASTMANWQATIAAQLKSLAEGQAQLNVNCGERLAGTERNMGELAARLNGLQLQLAEQFERLGAIEAKLADLEKKIPQPQAWYTTPNPSIVFSTPDSEPTTEQVTKAARKAMRPRAKPSKRRKAGGRQ